ncbi:transglutaminase domain-containing protein [Ruminococcus sp.]|uniref:transglutaminase domain-containing protein n=1 Tax=Ruminococcus sp. TaxID=41978 RepID=UPI0025D0F356|nr:transglutaminase domain-containing protein [Ruminococcus sp.]MBQ8965047.1 transglutaminase [Ruminococcus sp.]
MKKAICLAAAAALILGSCGLEEIKETFSEKVDEKLEQHAVETTEYEPEQVKEMVYDTLRSGRRVLKFDSVVDTDVIQQVVYSARYDCPEVFWTGGFVVDTDFTSTTLRCDSVHDLDETQLAEMGAELDAAAESIAAEVNSGASDYDRLLALHDKLIEICDYDYGAYSTSDPEEIGFAGSAYGCLIEHEAVCEGYAQAFSLVSRKMGFDSGMVCGTAGGDKHAWNYVKADGQYYWLDVTWDENSTETETEFAPMHKYFLLNDELFMGTRTVDDDVPFIPQCSSMEDNFYVHSGYYLDSYDLGTIDSLMSAAADVGGLDLMFADRASYDTAIDDLMEQGSIWNTQVMLGGAEPQPYFADPDLLTLTMSWR